MDLFSPPCPVALFSLSHDFHLENHLGLSCFRHALTSSASVIYRRGVDDLISIAKNSGFTTFVLLQDRARAWVWAPKLGQEPEIQVNEEEIFQQLMMRMLPTLSIQLLCLGPHCACMQPNRMLANSSSQKLKPDRVKFRYAAHQSKIIAL